MTSPPPLDLVDARERQCAEHGHLLGPPSYPFPECVRCGRARAQIEVDALEAWPVLGEGEGR